MEKMKWLLQKSGLVDNFGQKTLWLEGAYVGASGVADEGLFLLLNCGYKGVHSIVVY